MMKRASILIGDDEQGLRDLLHFTLEPLGYEVVSVENSLALVEALEARAFDLLIVDVRMLRMSGSDALARIRELRPAQRVLIVSSSCDASHEVEERLKKEAGIQCLYKPMSIDELTTAIERTLGERGRP